MFYKQNICPSSAEGIKHKKKISAYLQLFFVPLEAKKIIRSGGIKSKPDIKIKYPPR